MSNVVDHRATVADGLALVAASVVFEDESCTLFLGREIVCREVPWDIAHRAAFQINQSLSEARAAIREIK